MIDLTDQHICFACGGEFDWRIFRKEAVAPYAESQGRMRIYHSRQSEERTLTNVADYVYTEENTVMIDTVCPHCGEKSRIVYVKHS